MYIACIYVLLNWIGLNQWKHRRLDKETLYIFVLYICDIYEPFFYYFFFVSFVVYADLFDLSDLFHDIVIRYSEASNSLDLR